MLMAAGLGTRLRPFTDHFPKPLLPVMGIPCARFMFSALSSVGVKRVVANIHHLPEKARQGLSEFEDKNCRISISDESSLLLGSSGGIRKALSALGDTFFIANGDVLCSVDFEMLAHRHCELRKKHGVLITLAIIKHGVIGAKYREIVVDEQGLITGVGELTEGRPFYSGVAVADARAFSHLPEGAPSEFVPNVLLPVIQKKKAGAFITEGEWYDIGSPRQWRDTHLLLINKLEQNSLPEPWNKMIRKANRRIDSGIWVSNDDRSCELGSLDWTRPCYWSPYKDQRQPPRKLPGKAVLYGGAKSEIVNAGIGLDGLWYNQS